MREGRRGKREWAIVCSPLPSRALLHSFENDISSPPKERLFSSALCSFTPLQACAGLFLRVSDFPSWWNYLFRSMCPHAHHITLNHAQTYYTYEWLISLCFFRMLQNNQLERLPDDAPWDLPNLLSLWVFTTHMHAVIMLLDHRQQAISNSLATHSHISAPWPQRRCRVTLTYYRPYP